MRPNTRPGGLLSHGQAAYILGMQPQQLTRWVAKGKITPCAVTAGGHRRYLPADVHRLLGGGPRGGARQPIEPIEPDPPAGNAVLAGLVDLFARIHARLDREGRSTT